MGMFWGVGGILSCALPVFNTLCSLTNTMVAIDKTEVSIFWVPEPQVHTTLVSYYPRQNAERRRFGGIEMRLRSIQIWVFPTYR